MAIFQNNLLAGAGAQSSDSTYTIDQSLRFDAAATVNLIDSSVGAGDTRKKNTFSVWVKRGNLGVLMYLLGYRYDGTNYQYMSFDTSNRLEFTDVSGGSVIGKLITNRVFRDPSAWYNLTFVWDTANQISSERMIIYVNGVRETSFNTATYPSLNVDSGGAGRASSDIRVGTYDASGAFFDGYMANIVYIDNGALDPSSFGETNDNGIWIPKDVSDLTFGTRGFYVDGRDASDLGDDESGNGNDFSSGLSAHDQVLDSPTNNFAVYNILYNVGDVDFPTYSEANLSVDFNYFGKRSPVSTFALPTDSDAYCEFYIKTSASGTHNSGVGIGQGDANNAGNVALTNGVSYNFNGYKTVGGSASTFGNSYTAGDIIGVYFDLSDNEVDFYKNNTLEGSISLSTLSGDLFFLVANNATDQQVIIANFGQDDTFAGNKTSGSAGASDSSGNGKFYYTRISGAKALCSKSLGS